MITPKLPASNEFLHPILSLRVAHPSNLLLTVGTKPRPSLILTWDGFLERRRELIRSLTTDERIYVLVFSYWFHTKLPHLVSSRTIIALPAFENPKEGVEAGFDDWVSQKFRTWIIIFLQIRAEHIFVFLFSIFWLNRKENWSTKNIEAPHPGDF